MILLRFIRKFTRQIKELKKLWTKVNYIAKKEYNHQYIILKHVPRGYKSNIIILFKPWRSKSSPARARFIMFSFENQRKIIKNINIFENLAKLEEYRTEIDEK